MSTGRTGPAVLLVLSWLLGGSGVATASTLAAAPQPAYPWNYPGVRERPPTVQRWAGQCAQTQAQPRILLAGDSWAQFMWDDDTHNQLLDRFGLADRQAVSRSLGDNPGPGYTGSAYAVSGSEAREWVDTAQFPWIANVVSELQALPSIDTVLLSIGGNDLLAGRSGGGWYKDMDLDQLGAEAALFDQVLGDTQTIVAAVQAVRPDVAVLVSSYEYPNFNVSTLWCWIYACPKRRDLSRDPDNDLVTDSEINGLMLQVEERRIQWSNADPRLHYGHEIGAMHHYYGDGRVGPGVRPRPGLLPPDYQPFPAGNPLLPSLRENFRTTAGISADPIHLDEEGYRYKVALQLEGPLYERLRGPVDLSLNSLGGSADGWTDGLAVGTGRISVGAGADRLVHGLVSFDTSALPDDAQITAGSLWLLLDQRQGSNPFTSGQLGAPRLDLAQGSFGNPGIEAGDATAAADATDVGCFVGSVTDVDDALRIELTADGLAQLGRQGLTQFRLSFTVASTATSRSDFASGDAMTATPRQVDTRDEVQQLQPDGTTPLVEIRGQALAHRGLVERLGSARPVLTLRYSSDGLHRDGFED